MAARITDELHKQIIADYASLGSVNAVAKKHGLSWCAVKAHLDKDTETVKKCEQKKAENTISMLEYMDSKQADVQNILGLAMEQLPEAMAKCNGVQLATIIGILVDKFGNGGKPMPSADAVQVVIDV